ncbi:1511_t:CDS:2, partial [Gigaspora rosea]
RRWKKDKEGKDWKNYLNLIYNTYWSYRLNACYHKEKYTSEQEQRIVQKVIEKFKSDFLTFSVSDKIKKAHKKSIFAPPKHKNITPPKNKKTSFSTKNSRTVFSSSNIINTTNNNFQQSLSDKSLSSTKLSNKSSSLLINKQTTSLNIRFWSALPMNKSNYLADNDNNDTHHKNIIDIDDNTQQSSGSQAVFDNAFDNPISKSKKII